MLAFRVTGEPAGRHGDAHLRQRCSGKMAFPPSIMNKKMIYAEDMISVAHWYESIFSAMVLSFIFRAALSLMMSIMAADVKTGSDDSPRHQNAMTELPRHAARLSRTYIMKSRRDGRRFQISTSRRCSYDIIAEVGGHRHRLLPGVEYKPSRAYRRAVPARRGYAAR